MLKYEQYLQYLHDTNPEYQFVTTLESLAHKAGEAIGVKKERIASLKMILEKRFSALTPQQLQKIEGSSPEQLKAMVDQALDASSIEAVLG